VPLTHHTEETEFGLLPTPESYDWNSARTPEKWKEDKDKYQKMGVNLHCNLRQMATLQMLPTPTAMDSTNATVHMKSPQLTEGSMHSVTLTRAMAMGILPTPRTRDWKGCEGRRGDIPSFIEDKMGYKNGKTSQLNPLFVEEMMGFPKNWTTLPFLNGETKVSKPTETQ